MSTRRSISGDNLTAVQEGLRMTSPPDPSKLAAERAYLRTLEGKSAGARVVGYFRLMGPGYLQSAMTLGGGTAVSSLLAGALFGYALLWVAPAAMLIGVIMLTAISYQTLSTGMRPFDAMRRFAGPFFAWGWAIGAIVSSVIWHFPQYSLAAACLADIGTVAGIENLSPRWLGFIVLPWAVVFSMMYGSSPPLIRYYERLLKYMVWGIVGCFAWVVYETGIDDWAALTNGFFTFQIPGQRNGVDGWVIVLSGLAAAVGVNMVFLYPYTLLARGWNREHRRLARFDLYVGMFVPYVLASSLMVIAAANTIHLDPGFSASRITPVEAAQSLAQLAGRDTGRIVFGLGVLGMALSTITLHMLCTGFVCAELFGWKVGSLKYRLATLIPSVGVLGPVLWSKFALWLAVPTSILCGFLLPIAYAGFIVLQRNKRYLGDDTPRGIRGGTWLGAMVCVTLFLIVFLAWSAYTKGPQYMNNLFDRGDAAPVQVEADDPS
ncbi:MAG: divalent metal cation transporter [Phycisphaerales bacterium]